MRVPHRSHAAPERLARFDSTVLSRALLVLYLVYPGVSVAVFQCFSCTRLESGASFLDADVRITCWDATHRRYVGGAIVWLLLVPVGVPAFLTWLLHRFRVPQMARLLEQNAWLRAAVAHAWREGLAQPPGASRWRWTPSRRATWRRCTRSLCAAAKQRRHPTSWPARRRL